MFPGVTVLLKEAAHIGHGAIIHGATIGKNCLVGMNAVIMDNVVLGDECIVGALTFIKADEQFEARSIIVGNPGKKVKEVSDEMIKWKTEGTKLYQQLPDDMRNNWQPCEPLTEVPANQKINYPEYKTWNETKKSWLKRLQVFRLLAFGSFIFPNQYFVFSGFKKIGHAAITFATETTIGVAN